MPDKINSWKEHVRVQVYVEFRQAYSMDNFHCIFVAALLMDNFKRSNFDNV